MIISVLWINVIKNGRLWDESQGNQVIESSDKLKHNNFFWVIQELSNEHNQYKLSNWLLANFDAYLLDAR